MTPHAISDPFSVGELHQQLRECLVGRNYDGGSSSDEDSDCLDVSDLMAYESPLQAARTAVKKAMAEIKRTSDKFHTQPSTRKRNRGGAVTASYRHVIRTIADPYVPRIRRHIKAAQTQSTSGVKPKHLWQAHEQASKRRSNEQPKNHPRSTSHRDLLYHQRRVQGKNSKDLPKSELASQLVLQIVTFRQTRHRKVDAVFEVAGSQTLTDLVDSPEWFCTTDEHVLGTRPVRCS